VLGANDGTVLAMPRLVVIVGPTEPLATQLFAFGDAVVQSMWLAAAGKDYGVGAKAGATSIHLTGGAVPATMDHTALRAYVNAVTAANPSAAPDGNTIYLFFYPPGTTIGDNCYDLGAHGTLGTAKYAGMPTDSLAWVQRCPMPAGQTEIEALAITASHEIIESATDPYPRHGYAMPYQLWALSGKGQPPWGISSWSYLQGGAVETGDLCEGTSIVEGGFTYQRSWSKTAAAQGGDPCVPPSAAPYYSASPASDWIALPPGVTTSVPVTGWSEGPRADWHVTVGFGDTFQGGFHASFAGGVRTTTLNNGTTAMLSVTTPNAPGAFEVFILSSSDSPPDPTTGFIPQPATGDRKHMWAFGVRTTCPDCQPSSKCGDDLCDTAAGETCASCPDDCGPCGAVCGAANFGIPCGTSSCPTHSTCQPGNTCACDPGYASQACGGTPCSGASCTHPDWWCVPSACGMANFTTQCSSNYGCPAEGLCAGNNKCDCAPGAQRSTCDGQPCGQGGCSYPNWWCTVCGVLPGPIMCNGYTCPAFSACGPSQDCLCLSGYRAVSCDGQPCNGNCSAGTWWCYPE
jgi:hypothetical protein